MRSSRVRSVIALLLSCACTSALAEPAFDHYVKLRPENSAIGNFPAQKAPILTIKSGETVKIDTGGGAGWRNPEMEPADWLTQNNIPAKATDAPIKETIDVLERTLRYADTTTGHLLIGPIAIDGAMPGDSIEVRILSVGPRIPYGTTGRGPGRGLKQLPEGAARPPSKITLLDLKRNVGKFENGVEVPLGAVDSGEEGRKLELANHDVEPRRGEAGLDHLLQRGLAATHRQQLEPDRPPGNGG